MQAPPPKYVQPPHVMQLILHRGTLNNKNITSSSNHQKLR
jgi:hypothetical protein